MRKKAAVLVCVLCASLSLGACSLPAKVSNVLPDKAEEKINGILEKFNPDVMSKADGDTTEVSTSNKGSIFKVGSMECSPAEARIIMLSYQNQYSSIYGVDLWNHDYGDGEDLETYVKDLTLSQLAEVYTLNVIAGIEEVTLADSEKSAAAEAASEFYSGLTQSEKDYINTDEKTIAGLYEKYALAQKLYADLTKNVDTEISDDEARVQELMQIYMTDYSAASQVQQMLDEGSSFRSLCESYNEADEDTIYVSRQDFSDSNVADVVFALVEGEHTGLIQIDNGYYIYECEVYYDQDRTDAHKESVIQEHLDEYMQGVYDTYGSAVDSTLNESNWDQVRVDKTLELSGTQFSSIYSKYFG